MGLTLRSGRAARLRQSAPLAVSYAAGASRRARSSASCGRGDRSPCPARAPLLLPAEARLRGNGAPMIRARLEAVGLTPLAGLVAGRKVRRVAKTNVAVTIADVVVGRARRCGRPEPALCQRTLVGEHGEYRADQQCFHVYIPLRPAHTLAQAEQGWHGHRGGASCRGYRVEEGLGAIPA